MSGTGVAFQSVAQLLEKCHLYMVYFSDVGIARGRPVHVCRDLLMEFVSTPVAIREGGLF